MSEETIFAAVVVAVGLAITIRALRAVEALRRYELGHSTPGGVQFPTYEASKRHHARKSLWSLVAAAGTTVVVVGLVVFLRR